MTAALQWFDLSAIAPTPWKNGGGDTRELACWPPGAGMDAFEWRVSVATIAAPGPFSAFQGVQRQIMLLDGAGVRLRAEDEGIDHALDERWQPVAFAGDQAIDCIPLGGTSTDFNLMLRHGRWQGAVQVLQNACVPGSTPAGLCMVLSGRWHRGGEVFGPGQGLWWAAAAPAGACASLQPQAGGTDAPAIAWVALVPGFQPNRALAQ